jgi:hypothetical protein
LILTASLKPELLRERLAAPGPRLLSILSYLVLSSDSAEPKSPLFDELQTFLKSVEDLDSVRAVALGAFAAALFESRKQVVVASSKLLLQTTRQRLGLTEESEKEPYVRMMLDRMDVH